MKVEENDTRRTNIDLDSMKRIFYFNSFVLIQPNINIIDP